MANKYGIKPDLEKKLRREIKKCVYCGKKFGKDSKRRASWEHIDNDGPSSEANVVICCCSCNSSKGTKKLANWLGSDYCKKNGITRSKIRNKQVRRYLAKRG